MYKKKNTEGEFPRIHLAFGGTLRADNRWVQLAQIIPWDVVEERYASKLCPDNGRPAVPVRVALGALIIKEKLGFSDEETVEQIRENPYLQYFIGKEEYRDEKPFDSSMMVRFRKRLSGEILKEINDLIVEQEVKKTKTYKDEDDGNEPPAGAVQIHFAPPICARTTARSSWPPSCPIEEVFTRPSPIPARRGAWACASWLPT